MKRTVNAVTHPSLSAPGSNVVSTAALTLQRALDLVGREGGLALQLLTSPEGGQVTLRFYLVDPAQPAWVAALNPRLAIEIDAVGANSGVCNTGPEPVAGIYSATIPPITLPAGSRISVVAFESAAVASASRAVYGGSGLGGNYSDAGITLTTGTLQ